MAQKPRLPSTVNVSGTGSSAPVTRERQTFRRLQPPAHLDDDTKRFLTQLQDNIHESTLPMRCSPRLNTKTVEGVAMKKGAKVAIPHGLGTPFKGYGVTRAYSGSDPFSVVEASDNGGRDPAQYLVLVPSCTGTYDVEVFGG